jgi:hypothetical protein
VYHPSYVLRVPGQAAKDEAFQVMVDGLRQARGLRAPQGDGTDAAG